MSYSFGLTSKAKLSTVHPDLQRLFQAAIKDAPYDFSITEGIRTKERQKALFDSGKSQTMNSRHLTGHAVDVAIIIDGEAVWELAKYVCLMEHVKKLSAALNIPIVCGCEWLSFKDGPHCELDRNFYK